MDDFDQCFELAAFEAQRLFRLAFRIGEQQFQVPIRALPCATESLLYQYLGARLPQFRVFLGQNRLRSRGEYACTRSAGRIRACAALLPACLFGRTVNLTFRVNLPCFLRVFAQCGPFLRPFLLLSGS